MKATKIYFVILNFVFNITRCKESTEKQVYKLQRLLSYKLQVLLFNFLSLPLSVPQFPSASLASILLGQNSTYLELQSEGGTSLSD